MKHRFEPFSTRLAREQEKLNRKQRLLTLLIVLTLSAVQSGLAIYTVVQLMGAPS